MNATMERVSESQQQQQQSSQQQPQVPPAPPQRPISYAAPGARGKPPLSQRINVRMLVFAGVVLFLLGWPVYTFLSETMTGGIHNRGSYVEVNLKALGQFDFDPTGGSVKDVPAKYRALDGKRVMLEGEIYDPTEAGAISNWQLVYSIQKCCFNGPPRVQERVFCTAPKGKRFRRGDGYHKVTGILHVTLQRTKMPDGSLGDVEEVYHLDADNVEQS